jgi:hypothetical protein
MNAHLTPGEKRARASAHAAVARAQAHARPAQPDDHALAEAYPYVTPTRARQIRLETEETTQ